MTTMGWRCLLCLASLITSTTFAAVFCPDGTTTFERIRGIALPRPAHAFSELTMVTYGEARRYECHLLCSVTQNCDGFYIDHVKNTCRLIQSVATVRSDDLRPNAGSFFEKICLKGVVCKSQWAFDRAVGVHLVRNVDKVYENVTSRISCQESCLAEREFPCRSAQYYYSEDKCVLSRHDRNTAPGSFQPTTENVDYLESNCVKEPAKCQFESRLKTWHPYIQVELTSPNMSRHQCEHTCLQQTEFVCRSYLYNTGKGACFMTADNRYSLPRDAYQPSDEWDYYERTECLEVKMKCEAQAMTAIVSTNYAFKGRVYALSAPPECFSAAPESTTQLAVVIPLHGCGTRAVGNGTYENSLIIQNHPTILRNTDKRIDVACDYTEHQFKLKTGKDVTDQLSREGNATEMVMGVAPAPQVKLRIIDSHGVDTSGVQLGDKLQFILDMDDESVYGIFGRGLIASSGDSTESIELIDERGCPTQPDVFPALETLPDSKNLSAFFQAFRFTSDSTVHFQLTVSFCLSHCPPVDCDIGNNVSIGSMGRRKRALEAQGIHIPNTNKKATIVEDVYLEDFLTVKGQPESRDMNENDEIIAESIDRLSDPERSVDDARLTCMSTSVLVGLCIVLLLLQIISFTCCGFAVYMWKGRRPMFDSKTELYSGNGKRFGMPW